MDTSSSFSTFRSALSSLRNSENFNQFEQTQEKNTESTMNTFLYNLLNFANYTFYNTFNGGSLVDLFNQKHITLFGKSYFPTEDPLSLDKLLADTIVFTYRSYFNPIIQDTVKYTDDCSWGCMIRSGEMLFAKAFQKLETSKEKSIFTKQQITSLFLDSPIFVEEHAYLHSYYSQFKQNKLVYPPFAIQKLTERTNKNEKGAGKCYSNIDIVNRILKRKEITGLFNELEVFHCTQGFIEEEKIVEACFTTKDCYKCEERLLVDDYVIISIDEEDKEQDFCTDCLYLGKGRSARISKSGLVIISSMLGLGNLSEKNKESMLKAYKIRQNIGMLGGRKNRGFYFVGENEGNLLYLDPHLNQQNIKDISQIDEGSFDFKNMFELNPTEITASFSFAFMFTSTKEYLKLRHDLKEYSKTKEPIFKFKAIKFV